MKDMKDVCGCFGYTGHQSTTHVDLAGTERCDLCGMPCMHQIDGIDPRARRIAFLALTASAMASGLAMVVTARRAHAAMKRLKGQD